MNCVKSEWMKTSPTVAQPPSVISAHWNWNHDRHFFRAYFSNFLCARSSRGSIGWGSGTVAIIMVNLTDKTHLTCWRRESLCFGTWGGNLCKKDAWTQWLRFQCPVADCRPFFRLAAKSPSLENDIIKSLTEGLVHASLIELFAVVHRQYLTNLIKVIERKKTKVTSLLNNVPVRWQWSSCLAFVNAQ